MKNKNVYRLPENKLSSYYQNVLKSHMMPYDALKLKRSKHNVFSTFAKFQLELELLPR